MKLAKQRRRHDDPPLPGTSNYACASTLAATTPQHPTHPTHQKKINHQSPSVQSPPQENIYNFMPERVLGEQQHFHTPSPSSKSSSTNNTPSTPIISHTTLKAIEPKDINPGEFIGEGSFGTVRRGVWRGMDVALKILRLDAVNGTASAHSPSTSTGGQCCIGESVDEDNSLHNTAQLPHEYLKEVQTMALVCNHANVIQLVGMVNEASAYSPCIVTVYYPNGSVYDQIFKPAQLPPEQAVLLHESQSYFSNSQLVQWALEAAHGVHHLHQEQVIHRDLATRNLLLDDSFHVRVADFGFSRTKEAGASKGFTQSELGPVKWTAPEAMRQKLYSTQSDVFSFGVMLYELFAQIPPWAGYDSVEVVLQVCSGGRILVPDTVPPYISELIKCCWAQESSERPVFPDIIQALSHYDDTVPAASPAQYLACTYSEMCTSKDTSPSLNRTPSFHRGSLLDRTTSTLPSGGGTTTEYDFMPPSVHFNADQGHIHNDNKHTIYDDFQVDCDVSKLLAAGVHSSDASFYRQLRHTLQTSPHTLKNLLCSHESFLRVIYILLKSLGRSSESVDVILRTFKDMLQEEYHLTKTYFWIQLMTFRMESQASQIPVPLPPSSSPSSSSPMPNTPQSFSSFLKGSSGDQKDAMEINLNDKGLCDRYYSELMLSKSKYVFNLPDLQALPSIISKNT
mmetsp:Transcript_27391/g.46287  ORF Transcript_27391/g.46287 Transcript_27391/m.46287 type:complete len:680 (-) Transcript_27391:7292-9331(-)|eukprot:CAMPEP_0114418724 /NCGR_PEP_ID=MMETSP0103-20121206/3652_1 /TAXON_ID=37642 ORGANISM="Paraphysomonas imperforata, Strain PA2" /NCGR_SAMPLE_ID=MMETSP0103 /ASSEMBLY_ACC=CAM_ASM_000201 /LENGTH=679 /DNA_ID=CAMNT_0001587107 /DNA_START=8 /DNA_END=2043 /DNA_ORIENTATION=-